MVWNLAVWQRGLGDCCSLCVAGPALFEVISVYGDLFETELLNCVAVAALFVVCDHRSRNHQKKE